MIDFSTLKELYIDGNKATQLWIDGSKVKFGGGNEYLTFTALEAPLTVRLQKNGSPSTISLQYSTDGSDWIDYTVDDNITVNNVNDKVMFKAKTTNTAFSSNSNSLYKFYLNAACKVSGNIMSLLDANCECTTLFDAGQAFRNLFEGETNLVDASELMLPATILTSYCYAYMFYHCTSLSAPPRELPATTPSNNCYQSMFEQCMFQEAPAISA